MRRIARFSSTTNLTQHLTKVRKKIKEGRAILNICLGKKENIVRK